MENCWTWKWCARKRRLRCLCPSNFIAQSLSLNGFWDIIHESIFWPTEVVKSNKISVFNTAQGQLDGALGRRKISRESLTDNVAIEHTTIRPFSSIMRCSGKKNKRKRLRKENRLSIYKLSPFNISLFYLPKCDFNIEWVYSVDVSRKSFKWWSFL